MITPSPDASALAAVRRDAEHFRRLWRDCYWCALEYRATIEILSRQLAETREECARYSRQFAAQDGRREAQP